MRHLSIAAALGAGLVVVLLWSTSGRPSMAQDVAEGWAPSQPLNRSCCASYPMPVVDPWGQMHVLWAEQDGFISYSRLDADGWSDPVEILADPEGSPIWSPDADVSPDGHLHVVWTSQAGGPLYYSRAPAFGAGDARVWQEPVMVADRSLGCAIAVDSSGLVHLVYAPFKEGQSAVHVTTRDGTAWSDRDSVESVLALSWTGGPMQLVIDQGGDLHLAWTSMAFPEGFPPGTVYYQRSTDGGRTWSAPFEPDPQSLDRTLSKDITFKNNQIDVAVGLSGDVHLTWHQYTGSRWHRWSADGGQTWNPPDPLYPDMGAAFNGYVDMAWDSAGRLHTVASRQSVWYQSWEHDFGWAPPELVDPREPDWHHQRVAVVGGNQVYLFYADVNDTGIIWYTSRMVEAPSVAPEPRPELAPAPTAQPTATSPATPEVASGPGPTLIASLVPQVAAPEAEQGRSDELPILAGVAAPLLLVLVILGLRFGQMQRR